MIILKKKFSDSYNFLYNKIVLLRVDFNVPIQDKKITDLTRIKKVIPTISKLMEYKAKIVLISHFGRPKGTWSDLYTLNPVAKELELLLKRKIFFYNQNIKNIDKKFLEERFNNHDLIMLENIRFYSEEEQKNDKFTKKLSSLADLFINECFSSSHRDHASISGIPKFLPSFPGMLLEIEIQNLKNLFLESNNQDSVAIIGGAKISTKLKLIEYYAQRYSKVIIGGAMANTILKSQDHEIGYSLFEKKMLGYVTKIFEKYKKKILVPLDVVVTDKKLEKKPSVKLVNEVDKKDMIVDIGPQTRMFFFNEIINTKILLWNGPLGMFETKPFDEGTNYVLKAIKANKNKNFFSVAGGGDTIAMLNQTNCFEDFSFVSTGGGAFLEFIQGADMPGLNSLNY
jgi:phosphoglycerate kinase